MDESAFLQDDYYILNFVPLGHIIIDEAFRVLFWNQRMEEWSRIPAGEMVGKSLLEAYPHLKEPKYLTRMKMMFETGSPVVFSAQLQKYFIPIKTTDGKQWVLQQTMINPFKRVKGKVRWALVTIQDVTDPLTRLKEYRVMLNELEAANKELDAFAHTVSHDLRAPLRLITACVRFLREDHMKEFGPEVRNYIQRIDKGVQRLQSMIDDLLKLSRISRIRNPYEDTDMGQLVRSVVERLEYDIEHNNVDLVIARNMPVISCDCIKMAEVFQNLINNAIKFSSRENRNKRPRIEIGYQDFSPREHLFWVTDNGIGIEEKYHKQVFELFRRTEEAKGYDGTGAGLSIVKKVIDDHGGDIWIESQLGEGTTFKFTIPKKKIGEENG